MEFAKDVGVSPDAVERWRHHRADRTPRRAVQRLLDADFAAADPHDKARFIRLLNSSTTPPTRAAGTTEALAATSGPVQGSDDLSDITIAPHQKLDDALPGSMHDGTTMTVATRRQFMAAIAAAVVGSSAQLAPWHPVLTPSSSPLPARTVLDDVIRLRRTTDELRVLDSTFGGAGTVDITLGALNRGRSLLTRSLDVEVLTALRVALADLANVVAWAHHDAGQQDHARRQLAQGLHWALDSGTREGLGLAADMLFGLARVALHERDSDTALKMVHLGHIVAEQAADVAAAAQLHATAAWAHALRGDQRRVNDCLARAEHEMSLADPDTSEPWMQVFFAPGDYAGHQGLVRGVLASHATESTAVERAASAAIDLTTISLTHSGPDRPARSLLFDRIVAATNRFRLGDTATAIPLSQQIIAGLTDIASQRGLDRIPELLTAAAPHANDSTVADLVNDLTHLAPTPTPPT